MRWNSARDTSSQSVFGLTTFLGLSLIRTLFLSFIARPRAFLCEAKHARRDDDQGHYNQLYEIIMYFKHKQNEAESVTTVKGRWKSGDGNRGFRI